MTDHTHYCENVKHIVLYPKGECSCSEAAQPLSPERIAEIKAWLNVPLYVPGVIPVRNALKELLDHISALETARSAGFEEWFCSKAGFESLHVPERIKDINHAWIELRRYFWTLGLAGWQAATAAAATRRRI